MTTESQTTLRASHIAIGTELTSGQTLNTNSHALAEILQEVGIKNQFHIVVPDTKDLILRSFDFIAPYSDWIFVYGGLGPTTDDVTRNVVSEWCQRELILDPRVWQHIQELLNARNYPVREVQKQQAFFPRGAKIMENTKGTAHGFHLQAHGKEIFVLPGPPKEIQSILENYLKPWINTHSVAADPQVTEVWNTMGLGESEVAFQVENLIRDYDVVTGYRVHLPYVELKISFLKSQLEKNRPLVLKIQKTLEPILVYKNKYPYPQYFKTLFDSYSSISLIDEVTQGGVMTDLKTWIAQWEAKQIAYFNQSPATVFTRLENQSPADSLSGHLLFSITKKEETISVFLKSNKLSLRFEILLEPLTKMLPERKPLFIKEMIYREILTKNS